MRLKFPTREQIEYERKLLETITPITSEAFVLEEELKDNDCFTDDLDAYCIKASIYPFRDGDGEDGIAIGSNGGGSHYPYEFEDPYESLDCGRTCYSYPSTVGYAITLFGTDEKGKFGDPIKEIEMDASFEQIDYDVEGYEEYETATPILAFGVNKECCVQIDEMHRLFNRIVKEVQELENQGKTPAEIVEWFRERY